MSRFSRTTRPRAFAPFIPQLQQDTARNLVTHTGPLKVAFAWAVQPKVIEREDTGAVKTVDHERQQGSPSMTFASVGHYLRWRENIDVWQQHQDIIEYEPDFAQEVPDWLQDQIDQHRYPDGY